MRSITYLIFGLLFIFIVVAAMVAQPDVSVLAGIIIGGLTLALIPLIIYWMRSVPKRDRKHEDDEIHF